MNRIAAIVIVTLFTGAPAFAQGQGTWDAIAYGVSKGNKVTGLPSREAARDKALAECGADCKVYAVRKGTCAAVAVTGRGAQFYVAGADLSQAETEAISKCTAAFKTRGVNCSVGISHCNR